MTQSLFDISPLTLQERKDAFLSKLRTGDHYKRYAKSPLRYAGGKSLAVGLILEHFPTDITRLVSPFLGGGNVEIATALELKLEVHAYDIFDILINFWNTAITRPNPLLEALRDLNPTKDTYAEIKAELARHFRQETALDTITLARDYYFNFNLSYAPAFLGWMSNIYDGNTTKYTAMLNRLETFATNPHTQNLKPACASFEQVFKQYPTDFFYCDPPYYMGDDSKIFAGIYPSRNIPIHHNGFRHDTLRDLLHSHQGRWVLSYNDCEWVREAYKDFKILTPKWQYTMGQGETRIGKNRIERGDTDNIKQSHELLIIKD